jgi:hypothetical protein
MNGELVRIWEEALMACLNLSQNYPEILKTGTENIDQ